MATWSKVEEAAAALKKHWNDNNAKAPRPGDSRLGEHVGTLLAAVEAHGKAIAPASGAAKVKNALEGDVWESEHRRSKVLRVQKHLTGNRVYFANAQAGGGYGVEMSALEYVFVAHRKLVERGGKAVV